MIPSKEEAYKIISALVERFEEQLPSYKQTTYNETLTRKDFIDPFFKALGWDMNNSNGYAEAYREVIHEDKLKIGSATKAPDYSFRLVGGKRLFFVEAKKPSVAVKDDILPAYQVRRYGLLSQGNTQQALDVLRKAYKLWQDLNIPYEIARARFLLGIAYRETGDKDSADLETTAAQWIFKKLDAIPDLKRADEIIGENKKDDFYGLTNREREVLRLVASGETNKSIADKLFISERTVDRHLSNIFNKLNVTSRTAASTFALTHKLV